MVSTFYFSNRIIYLLIQYKRVCVPPPHHRRTGLRRVCTIGIAFSSLDYQLFNTKYINKLYLIAKWYGINTYVMQEAEFKTRRTLDMIYRCAIILVIV